MNVKVEIKSATQIKDLKPNVERILNTVPQEHLRGLTKIVFSDFIAEPRLTAVQRSTLPALYHPRMPGQMAWGEVALSVLAPKKKFPQSLLTRLSLKSTVAQVILSLVAQHYYMTLSKGIKKNQLETACRVYVEKQFEKWRENEGGLRVRLLKPFKPQLDRMARKLAKRYKEELERKQLNKR